MAGDEDTNKDYVYSEKIITTRSDASLDEKYDEDKSSQLTNSKDRKLDPEHQLNTFGEDQEDFDLAVINEIALTEDDVNMKVLTLRSMLIGCVSVFTFKEIAQ